MENKYKRFYLTIKGQKVKVSEEIYREYIRPIRADQRKKRREWKCLILSESGNCYVRCTKKCESCLYYLAGNSALGNITSLDRLVDCEVEIEDKSSNLEVDYMERETTKEEYALLHRAILQLTPRQREIVRMIYFEGKSQEEVARELGKTQSTISITLNRALENLKKIFS